ncbi:uncharacterized protein LTR77_007397 [Saxophila tyrrhenica]|uniref:Glycosyl transferase CAP10 domain-containing protein n=1 Tax=Saxophila tyrrhenica TaxID=1690608 RepID=A0AAV9P522_9PEZI|nr:hypothetical protein LTR77_007397 [Saxophila tyrrhenica]
MSEPPLLTRRLTFAFLAIFTTLLVANVLVLNHSHNLSIFYQEWLPSVSADATQQRVGSHTWQKSQEPGPLVEIDDMHPIRELIRDADQRLEEYDYDRSKTFKETVEKYRRMYGRHPPPGFKEWYKFARRKHVHSIDDFAQIHDDLRPFWSIPPTEIRHYAAHSSDDPAHGLATIHLRGGQVFQETWGWRSETFIKMLKTVSRWLPDMDIPVNRMDQPRVVVPWEDMQSMLAEEEKGRTLETAGVNSAFTESMEGLWHPNPRIPEPAWINRWNPFIYLKDHRNDISDPHPPYGWFPYANKQFMDLAAKACPPNSYARNADSAEHQNSAERSYKHREGYFITNFNLSSDLCTVGPTISNLHGMLYASTSMLATHKLVPVFSESKTNVNNDILFPANMYFKSDPRYVYDDEQDIDWDDKNDMMPWRGVTSGGTAYASDPGGWKNMHRQRLVMLTNSTALFANNDQVEIRTALPEHFTPQTTYEQANFTNPALADFADAHTDVGFTGKLACVPNCSFYDDTFAMMKKTSFAETFKSKYLIDVDGHSFSGRWRAFLQSRSLGLKATIFREWHDSRLFAWRHFVPLSNEFNELYSLLTYFIGLQAQGDGEELKVERHDYEAFKMAEQGRKWAQKVLRKEDIEIYLYRLLLEYARIIDDNRDNIGFKGDGGEEMESFDMLVPAMA